MEQFGAPNRMNSGALGLDKTYDIVYNIELRGAEKLLRSARANPAGLRFGQLLKLARAFGCVFKRQAGSHLIYGHEGVPENLNFQPVRGMAKDYQVKQLLGYAKKYGLTLGGDSDE